MSDPVWYRSLYWRIAFGFITLLAVVLLVQIVVFLWLTDRIVGPSSKSPQQLAASIAAEVAPAVSNDPTLQLDPYLHNKFGHIYQPFLVVLNDGRFGSNRGDRLPPGFLRSMMPRGRRGRFGDPGRGGDPGRPDFGRPDAGRSNGGDRPGSPEPSAGGGQTGPPSMPGERPFGDRPPGDRPPGEWPGGGRGD